MLGRTDKWAVRDPLSRSLAKDAFSCVSLSLSLFSISLSHSLSVRSFIRRTSSEMGISRHGDGEPGWRRVGKLERVRMRNRDGPVPVIRVACFEECSSRGADGASRSQVRLPMCQSSVGAILRDDDGRIVSIALRASKRSPKRDRPSAPPISRSTLIIMAQDIAPLNANSRLADAVRRGGGEREAAGERSHRFSTFQPQVNSERAQRL